MFFCPQVQPLWEIITFQSLQIIPLPLWITLNHVYWGLFHKQHGMCAEPECVVIHRGQAANEGRGHCLSWGGGVDSLWGNMTWGPPASSHRITCDRGEPPPYKSHSLLLFSSSPPSLPACSICSGLWWDTNKSHIYCLAVSDSLPFSFKQFYTCAFAVKRCNESKVYSECTVSSKIRPREKCSPSPIYYNVYQYYIHQFS